MGDKVYVSHLRHQFCCYADYRFFFHVENSNFFFICYSVFAARIAAICIFHVTRNVFEKGGKYLSMCRTSVLPVVLLDIYVPSVQ